MKVIFDRKKLLNALFIAEKAISIKTNLNILECFHISAANDRVTITSNNNEIGIETVIDEGSEIIEEGETAVDAKLFSDIIKKLDEDGDVTFNTNGNIAIISTYQTVFKMQENDPDNFPLLNKIPEENKITLSQYTLREIIRDTIFSISNNDSNKMMTGELFSIQDSKLKAVTLDGHRISIKYTELSTEYDTHSAIIPGSTLTEISKIIEDNTEKNVDIYFGADSVMFKFDNTVMTSRLIDGKYFNVDSMISYDYRTKVSANRKKFLSYIEQCVILFKETDKRPLVLNITDNAMNMKLNSSVASFNSDMDIVKTGNDLMIGFNPRFLLDVLRVLDDEDVNMYMTSSKSPCFIRDDDGNYIYTILPINFNPAMY